MPQFEFYSSLPYWLAFLAVLAAVRLLGSGRRVRQGVLLAASGLMLLALPGFTPVHLAILAVLILLSFAAGSLLGRPSDPPRPGRRLALSAGLIAATLLVLCFYKYGFFQRLVLGLPPLAGLGTGHVVRMVGVSYFTFKIIHFIVESYRSKIEGLDLLTYANYVVFFPAFISGPINRYNPFAASLRSGGGRSAGADLGAGAERIVHGLFKKFVLVQLLYPHILTNAASLKDLSVLGTIGGLYAYAFYFYFDFSGYTDLAIGCARLLGIDLPENFNHPFLKKNIRELWTNWHMSLTSWLVDYIYWPIVRRMRNIDVFRSHPIALSNAGMIITFIVCGMWHGEGLNFIVWGAYHGLGISVATVYQRAKRSLRSPGLQRYFRSRASAVVGVIVTFNFFALGLAFFVLDWGRLGILLRNLASRF
ncbi:MAG TPA: MBOAT family O-acyltransferase [Candidatus Aminicenantes bacterium]|nr:MBOAT family O-acyltransferase [Candidatus Aminicenantes bacterium]HRY64889.1 MBOAT family O-acyltransferase [Candidatus Aminicenantes bacterium]HRZ71802.1 MBOAT family O-acyltransferase [Candidatus Aminicenantes bacterium]